MCITLANPELQLLLTWPVKTLSLESREKCFTVQIVVSSFCVCMHVLATTFRSTLMEPCFTILCLCTPQEGAKKLCWGIEFFAQTLCVLLYYKLSILVPQVRTRYIRQRRFLRTSETQCSYLCFTKAIKNMMLLSFVSFIFRMIYIIPGGN